MYGDDDTGTLLARLSRAWEAEHPRRAVGGAHALSGFSFQFSLALLETLERWRGLAGDRRANPGVFVELLSDVVQKSVGGSLRVTQVKRTQTPSAIRAGLEDLQSVYDVAAVELPEHLSRLELELAFRTGRPEEAWPVIDAWVEEDPDARAGLVESVLVNQYPDPENRIYALLVNGFNAAEPVALLHRWLGGMMSAAGQPNAEARRARLQVNAEEIWASLIELEKSTGLHGGIYLWSPVDRLPDRVRSGGVLTGRQPSVVHLSNGYLAARPDALGRIRRQLERWLAERARAQVQTTVPMFWIGGRSGSGKSALLLQLLSALQGEGTGPVLWLSDKSELLAEAARWAREAFASERPPVIGLDDPYAPDGPRDQVWGSFLAELSAGLQAGEGEGVPILVCAGPGEQAEAFACDFSSDFDIEVVELEREQPEELARLRGWYEQRTGAQAPGPEDENVLLVQLFFEWKAGLRLDAFAQRFRRRLQDADREIEDSSMVSVLAEVLALNRIYVGYPTSDMKRRLSDRQADFLRRLRDEEHIAIDEEPGRSGVWIAHPHLANEIYESWFPRQSTVNQRRGHFVDATLACLRSGERSTEKTAPIRAVAQALSARGHVLSDRIDREFVAALPELYGAARDVEAEMPIDQLRLWVEVQLLADAPLDPDPVEGVLPRIEPGLCDDPSATRLCEMLLAAFERLTESQRERLRVAIADLLTHTPDWSNWPRVAAAAAQTHAMPELADLIDGWLGERLGRYSSGWPLLAALEEYGDDTRFEAHALRLLQAWPRHPAWGRAWTTLWQRRPAKELVGLGTEWLKVNDSDRSWTFVWRALARDAAGAEITKLGADWLDANSDHAGWSVVWEGLWSADPSAHLEELGLRWLDGADVNREGFGVVWCNLWDSGLREQAFCELGEAALRRMNTGTRAWEHVLSRFLEDPSEEFWQVGMNWAQAAALEDRAWGKLLPRLLDAAYARGDTDAFDALIGRGYDFLREADPGHLSWSNVFCTVWDAPNDELRSLGRGWIEETGDSRRGWTFVWMRLWEEEPSEWLAGHALPWLRDNIGAPGWTYIWTWLCEEGPEDCESFDMEALIDLGEHWLDATPASDSGWTYVFLALWKRRPHETARRLGMEWLAERKGRYDPVWDRVWAALWGDPAHRVGEEGAALRRLGVEWLECSPEHEHWTTVWAPLWDDRPDQRLRELGDQWTRHGGAGNSRRRWVIIRLVSAEGDLAEATKPPASLPDGEAGRVSRDTLRREILKHRTEEAIAKGFELVREGPSSDLKPDQWAWKRLWAALWRVRPSDELRRLAIEWLETPVQAEARGRSHVWEILWKAEPSTKLYAIGCDYLESAPYKRAKWSAIWQELWRYRDSVSLHRLAVRWLGARLEPSLGEAQSPWPEIWLRAFEADPTPELAALGRRWLRGAPGHREAAQMRQLLLELPAPEELEVSGQAELPS